MTDCKGNEVFAQCTPRTSTGRPRQRYGESRSGENCGRSKLKKAEVLRIKQYLRDGVKQRAIAEKFGVNFRTISAIATGQNWTFVESDPVTSPDL